VDGSLPEESRLAEVETVDSSLLEESRLAEVETVEGSPVESGSVHESHPSQGCSGCWKLLIQQLRVSERYCIPIERVNSGFPKSITNVLLGN